MRLGAAKDETDALGGVELRVARRGSEWVWWERASGLWASEDGARTSRCGVFVHFDEKDGAAHAFNNVSSFKIGTLSFP